MTKADCPRLVVGGLGGDSGKTLLSLGLLFLAQERGLRPAAFKKGPDYIDAAWLAWASGRPARNLDTYLMGTETAAASFRRHAAVSGLSVVEGNRGLYDGADAAGTHSTAELAKLLGAPVVLVANATKVTRTLAAVVLGCQRMDPEVKIGGVVLNQVSGRRHESVIRRAVEETCGIPVLGVLPRAGGEAVLPGRHLGLVTPEEHPRIAEVRANLLALVRPGLNWEAVWSVASGAPPLEARAGAHSAGPAGHGLRIGVVRDSAFTFYYPENLEALEAAGAALVQVSALQDGGLPEEIHALYIGGGFPETHGAALGQNRPFLGDLRRAADRGLPIYAECGGLMLLSRAIRWEGRSYEMAGVLPFEVEVCRRPQGHGYADLEVDAPNPFFPVGTRLRGHEFHYSRLLPGEGGLPATACRVLRGTGAAEGRDGLVTRNVWASYTHLHHLGTPAWSEGLLGAAMRYRDGGPPDGTTL